MFLVVNKVDSEKGEFDVVVLWLLGLGELYVISVMYGWGVVDLFDGVFVVLFEVGEFVLVSGGFCWVVLVGKLNVGKSFLLNKFVGD